MSRKKLMKLVIGIVLVVIYFVADAIMDITLYPRLSDSLKEHHVEIVSRHMIFLNLAWVWLLGYVSSNHVFKRYKNKLAKLTSIVFGSALFATIFFSFTSLPFIWIAYTFPSVAFLFLFFHDYGLSVYFAIMIFVLVCLNFKRTR